MTKFRFAVFSANCLEQITGDDTPALQSVLDADVWRKHLLQEQEVSLLAPIFT